MCKKVKGFDRVSVLFFVSFFFLGRWWLDGWERGDSVPSYRTKGNEVVGGFALALSLAYIYILIVLCVWTGGCQV